MTIQVLRISEEYDEDDQVYVDQAYAILRGSGIRSAYDLMGVAVASHPGKAPVAVGAVFGGVVSMNEGIAHFSWDTVVAPDFQRRGVARLLIDFAMEHKEELADAYGDLRYTLDVINPHMRDYLRGLGFIIDPTDRDGRLMLLSHEWPGEGLEERERNPAMPTRRRRNPDASEIRDMLYRGDKIGALAAWHQEGGDEVAGQYLANSLDIPMDELPMRAALAHFSIELEALRTDDKGRDLVAKSRQAGTFARVKIEVNGLSVRIHQAFNIYYVEALLRAETTAGRPIDTVFWDVIEAKKAWLRGDVKTPHLYRARRIADEALAAMAQYRRMRGRSAAPGDLDFSEQYMHMAANLSVRSFEGDDPGVSALYPDQEPGELAYMYQERWYTYMFYHIGVYADFLRKWALNGDPYPKSDSAPEPTKRRKEKKRIDNPDAGEIRDMLYRGDILGALVAWYDAPGDIVARQYLAGSLGITEEELQSRADIAKYGSCLLACVDKWPSGDDALQEVVRYFRNVDSDVGSRWPRINHAFNLAYVSQLLAKEEQEGRNVEAAFWWAINAKRAYLQGNATDHDLEVAQNAAESAYGDRVDLSATEDYTYDQEVVMQESLRIVTMALDTAKVVSPWGYNGIMGWDISNDDDEDHDESMVRWYQNARTLMISYAAFLNQWAVNDDPYAPTRQPNPGRSSKAKKKPSVASRDPKMFAERTSKPVAAVFVQAGGAYFDEPGIDPWDANRDARAYDEGLPVVAHPPCKRWGNFWFGSPNSTTRYELGDDGGCFEAALAAVRKHGGVLEHPAGSRAWKAFGLNKPPKGGGWGKADDVGGWTAEVEQGHYGHRARKKTWLYAHSTELPNLQWGPSEASIGKPPPDATPEERKRITRRGAVGMMGYNERAATPEAFKDLLIRIAQSVYDKG